MTIRGVDGIAFPGDMAAWRRWEARQRRLQRAAAGTRRLLGARGTGSPVPAQLLLPEDEPDVLVVVDAGSPSARAAVGEPLRFLDPRRTAVLTRIPAVVAAYAPGRHATDFSDPERIPRSVREVVTLGAFNELAGTVEPWARRNDARFGVVQHGALTPWAPPLADGTHLFAWSDDDAAYWASGRRTITAQTVGSQLLWSAGTDSAHQLTDDRPVMLGQLHGIELPAAQLQRVYTAFCTEVGADYRPHPNEYNALSRLRHRAMRHAGVQFDTSSAPIPELTRPVVSVFSTGTIEAAQSGIPAFVHHPEPPPWLSAFWRRYRLSRFGGPPSAPVEQPENEPARSIAEAVQP